MKLVRFNDETVKIIISSEELISMNMTFDELCKSSYKTTVFFQMLSESLGEKFVKNTFVEVFNLDEEGMIIYLSIIPEKSNDIDNETTITFETRHLDKLIELCNGMKNLEKTVHDDILYTNGINFRLIIKIPSDNTEGIKKLVNKYKIYAKRGTVIPALTKEHSEVWVSVLKDNAVKYLSEGF